MATHSDPAVTSAARFHPLRIGSLSIDPPVVLAPMAGVTNAPFRTLCRRFSAQRCLYVGEMITARAFVDGHARTRQLATFGAEERGVPRSIQLYGTDARYLGEAARILVEEDGADHIDLNFGCPVRKVTASGGGAAIPLRPRLLARLVRAVVVAAGRVPVTMKFRKGVDDGLITCFDAGRVGESEGCAAIALHARTAAQLYSGSADWPAIAALKQAITTIPVLGNGDIFEGEDALRMMRETGCDGVVVGRGCLGRPWLFRDLCAAFDGTPIPAAPALGEVVDVLREHARLLAEFFGERIGVMHVRKWTGWYLRGFRGARRVIDALCRVATLAELEAILLAMPREEPYPLTALRAKRCKGGQTQTVSLPPGFLVDRFEDDREIGGGDECADADEAARHGG
ncbi:MAG: tRNA dihydrouridine synthase DusB [Planctomycetes bacterium]|nr:tRNA dihydrouridine synthase DusB [Planctomycetota bacterium]